MFVISVVLQWPQTMSVRGVGEGVGDGLALALDVKSVAARQAQAKAATFARTPRALFAVRLVSRIEIELTAGIMRSEAINLSVAHTPLWCGTIDTPVIFRRVAKATINRVVLDKLSMPIDSQG